MPKEERKPMMLRGALPKINEDKEIINIHASIYYVNGRPNLTETCRAFSIIALAGRFEVSNIIIQIFV